LILDSHIGYSRHIDAALYDLNPPKVTTLYAHSVPAGDKQIVRYDDGTGDELEVPLGTTACISIMLKSSRFWHLSDVGFGFHSRVGQKDI
jgi:hypothetical protein